MARTIAEIYDSIVAEKNSLATLSGLLEDSSSNAATAYKRLLADVSSSSKVAAWRLWCFIVAVASWVLENLWDKFKKEVNELADQAISGNIYWYERQIDAFQYGYDLVRKNDRFVYEAIDETAMIIKRRAIVEVEDEFGIILYIKVAKLDNNGNIIPLTSEEIIAFTAYMKKIRFAGTKIKIISNIADDLKYNLTVYFNPLLGIDNISNNTDLAIETYLGNLEFNGAYNKNKFIDSIQSAEGVVDIVDNSIQSRYGSLAFAEVGRQYVPNAGYFAVVGGIKLNTVTNNPDGSITKTNSQGVTITYVPYV